MIGAELQKAIYSALTGSSPPLAGGRVYDNPPDEKKRIADTGAAFPYITIGDEQVLDAGNSCQDGWEVFHDVHIWSRPSTQSKVELKTILADVVDVLARQLTVTDFRTIVGALQSSRALRDPDGITEHAVLTFRFLLDPA